MSKFTYCLIEGALTRQLAPLLRAQSFKRFRLVLKRQIFVSYFLTMENFSLSYREVIPDQTVTETWKEVTLNTGISFNCNLPASF